MHLEFFNILLLILLTDARYAFKPQFYAEDSAIIVDANKEGNIQPNPIYQIIQIPKGTTVAPTTRKTTTPTTTITTTLDEFPHELLVIAKQKLGLKRLDEIPSINELGELLGTNSADETLQYLTQLTKTEQGIALLKSYIESTDYTDSSSGVTTNDDDDDDDINLQITTPAIKKEASILERMAAYLMNWLPTQQPAQNHEPLLAELIVDIPKPTTTTTTKKPIYNLARHPVFVRKPLPFHYPIPIRPMVLTQRHYNDKSRPPHISTTKKLLLPAYMEQLARLANIPAKNLAVFLESKPKLAELAAKFSYFATQRDALVNTQLFAALQRAIDEDEDLQKLLSSTKTLK